jgi:hypothetical protein
MTRFCVSAEMREPVISFSTSETLDCDTPAMRATSVMVGLPRRLSLCAVSPPLPSAIRSPASVLSGAASRAAARRRPFPPCGRRRS